MNAIRQVFRRFQVLAWPSLDPASLQFRLTLAIALASLSGLGGFSIWTSWRMQHMIIAAHRQDLTEVIDHLPATLASASSEQVKTQAVQDALDHWSDDDRWVWIRQADGQVITQSAIAHASPQSAFHWSAQSALPRIDVMGGRYMVWCSQPIQINHQMGQVYVAHDVTEDYTLFLTLSRNLGIGTLLASGVLTITGSMIVRRSLGSLRQTREWASNPLGHRPPQTPLDITHMPSEVKDLAHTWNLLLDQVSKTGEQQRQFASGVSHELRTPLCVVYGYLQSILRRGTNLTDQQKEALEIATAETERTILLLQDLLDLVRAECHAITFQAKPLQLNPWIEAGILATEEFRAQGITVEAPPESVWAIADADYLIQVLTHLLRNAVQFGNQQPIVVRLRQEPRMAVIEVCDGGCGITADQQSHIFEPFYRIDPSRARTTGGVGLGLAIAKSLVIGMGGTIEVTSNPGQGSTFTVRLPALSHPLDLSHSPGEE